MTTLEGRLVPVSRTVTVTLRFPVDEPQAAIEVTCNNVLSLAQRSARGGWGPVCRTVNLLPVGDRVTLCGFCRALVGSSELTP